MNELYHLAGLLHQSEHLSGANATPAYPDTHKHTHVNKQDTVALTPMGTHQAVRLSRKAALCGQNVSK